MSKGEIAVIGMIWAGIGTIMAFLDLLDVLQLGAISMASAQCAKAGSATCLAGTMQTLILFMLDVAIGPLLLAANLMTNPFLGIFGVIAGLIILYLFYGGTKGNIIPN